MNGKEIFVGWLEDLLMQLLTLEVDKKWEDNGMKMVN